MVSSLRVASVHRVGERFGALRWSAEDEKETRVFRRGTESGLVGKPLE